MIYCTQPQAVINLNDQNNKQVNKVVVDSICINNDTLNLLRNSHISIRAIRDQILTTSQETILGKICCEMSRANNINGMFCYD